MVFRNGVFCVCGRGSVSMLLVRFSKVSGFSLFKSKTFYTSKNRTLYTKHLPSKAVNLPTQVCYVTMTAFGENVLGGNISRFFGSR